MSQWRASDLHRILAVLHAIVALNAIGGGVYGFAGAEDVPLAWLDGTPFQSYRAPSVILLVVVGGLHSVASIFVWRKLTSAYALSLVAGMVLVCWIVVQVAMIGFVSWLQPAVGVAAVLNLVLARTIKRSSLIY